MRIDCSFITYKIRKQTNEIDLITIQLAFMIESQWSFEHSNIRWNVYVYASTRCLLLYSNHSDISFWNGRLRFLKNSSVPSSYMMCICKSIYFKFFGRNLICLLRNWDCHASTSFKYSQLFQHALSTSTLMAGENLHIASSATITMNRDVGNRWNNHLFIANLMHSERNWFAAVWIMIDLNAVSEPKKRGNLFI